MVRQQLFLPGANRLALRIAVTRRERPHRERVIADRAAQRKLKGLQEKVARVTSESQVVSLPTRRKDPT